MAVLKANAYKAPGEAAIPAKVIKNDTCIIYLMSLIPSCFNEETVPLQRLHTIIQPALKHEEDRTNPLRAYRGIALITAIYKTYCDILNRKKYTMGRR